MSHSSNPPRIPRRFRHRGVLQAVGFQIDTRLVSPSEIRRRVLMHWKAGTTVFERGDKVLVRWQEPAWLSARSSVGELVVLLPQWQVLSTVPLDADEANQWLSSHPSVVDLDAGQVVVSSLSDWQVVSLSDCVDLTEWTLDSAESLGALPVTVVVDVEPASTSVRSVFKQPFAAISDELKSFALSIKSPDTAQSEPIPASAPRTRSWFSRWTASFFATLSTLFSWLASRSSSSTTPRDPRLVRTETPSPTQVSRAESTAPALGLATRLAQWFQSLASRWAIALPMRATPDEQYSKYFHDLFKTLDEEDLNRALRMAIPLSAEPSDAVTTDQWFRMPQPRDQLTIHREHLTRHSTTLGSDLFERIRTKYKETANRLIEQKRFEEAAFVLAELLGDAAAAVAMLETHKLFSLAAEIAETRRLQPALVARLWLLAGHIDKALLLARRMRCFAELATAVRSHDNALGRHWDSPDSLTCQWTAAWARFHASNGEYVQAVRLAREQPSLLEEALSWIALGLSSQSGFAVLIAAQLELDPDVSHALEVAYSQLARLLSERGTSAHSTLVETARELAVTPARSSDDGFAAFSSRLERQILLTSNADSHPEARNLLKLLSRRFGHTTFEHDLPKWDAAQTTRLEVAQPPMQLRIEADDRGLRPVFDAVCVGGESVVMALGEAGLHGISRFGKQSLWSEQPTHSLVAASEGKRLLALTQRGSTVQVKRVLPESRTLQTLGVAQITHFAKSFDGDRWFASHNDQLFVLDVLQSSMTMLHKVVFGSPHHVFIRGFFPDDQTTSVLIEWSQESKTRTKEVEAWILENTTFGVKTRSQLRIAPDALVANACVLSSDAVFLIERSKEHSNGSHQLSRYVFSALASESPQRASHVFTFNEEVLDFQIRHPWILLNLRATGGVSIVLLDQASLTPRWKLFLATSRRVATRMLDGFLTIGDDLGRVLVYRLDTGLRVHNHRVK